MISSNNSLSSNGSRASVRSTNSKRSVGTNSSVLSSNRKAKRNMSSNLNRAVAIYSNGRAGGVSTRSLSSKYGSQSSIKSGRGGGVDGDGSTSSILLPKVAINNRKQVERNQERLVQHDIVISVAKFLAMLFIFHRESKNAMYVAMREQKKQAEEMMRREIQYQYEQGEIVFFCSVGFYNDSLSA